MKHHGLLSVTAIVMMLVFVISCRENPDETWPQVMVSLPEAGVTFTPGDTIVLKATFSDDRALDFVKATLTDANGLPVLAPVSVAPQTNPYTLDAELVVRDMSLKGGIHNLLFQASDGTNTGSTSVILNINELEREFLYPCVVVADDDDHFSILRTDTAGIFRTLYSYQGDFLASDISSAFKLLFYSGRIVTDVEAFSLAENKWLWSVPCQQSPSGHWFEMLKFAHPWLFVAQYDGYIRAYDRNGIQQFKSQMVANNYADLVNLFGDYVIASMKEYSTSNRQLAVFHVSGGKLLDLQPAGFIPAGFEQLSTNQVLVFGSQGNDGIIAIYDIALGTLSIINRIRNHTIRDFDRMSERVFYLAAGNEILYYTYDNNSVFPLASGYENAHIACENIGGQQYIASGNTLYVLDGITGTVLDSWHFDGTVMDVNLVYNK